MRGVTYGIMSWVLVTNNVNTIAKITPMGIITNFRSVVKENGRRCKHVETTI